MGSPSELTASCSCGAVRLALVLPAKWVAHCHCANCRRAHGAGVVTWAGFPVERSRVMAGEECLASYLTETGATRRFCRDCGSPLTYESPRWPGEVHVAVGCLDGPLGQPPAGHAYADRAPDWCPILDDLPRSSGN